MLQFSVDFLFRMTGWNRIKLYGSNNSAVHKNLSLRARSLYLCANQIRSRFRAV